MLIGEQAMCGFNTAKALGDETLQGENIRLEAMGHDWLVFRDTAGRAHAVDFVSHVELVAFVRGLNE